MDMNEDPVDRPKYRCGVSAFLRFFALLLVPEFNLAEFNLAKSVYCARTESTHQVKAIRTNCLNCSLLWYGISGENVPLECVISGGHKGNS